MDRVQILYIIKPVIFDFCKIGLDISGTGNNVSVAGEDIFNFKMGHVFNAVFELIPVATREVGATDALFEYKVSCE